MFNFIKSIFTNNSAGSEAEGLVEELARQNVRSFPFDLSNLPAGVTFQNADPQTKHTIIMSMLAWLEQHPLNLHPQNQLDQKAWQEGWQMRQAFMYMLKEKIPFNEQDVIAILNWSTGRSSGPLYPYLRAVPQTIKVLGDYLKNQPLSDELSQAIGKLIQSLETEQMSVENRRWILRLQELRGDTEVTWPLAVGDIWADTALS